MPATGKILVELQEHMGSDEAIANAAWTSSYDGLARKVLRAQQERVATLVRRLAEEGHAVPFESVVLRFWIRHPIFTDRQHMTHRIASHNGLSGRYRTMPDDWFPMPDDVKTIFARIQDPAAAPEVVWYDQAIAHAYHYYESAMGRLKAARADGKVNTAEFKRAREILRGVIPLAGMVERTTIMNLRSFANYQRQRNSEHAQNEIRLVAELMLQAVEETSVCPVALEALKGVGWRL